MKFRVGDYVQWCDVNGRLIARAQVQNRNGQGWVDLHNIQFVNNSLLPPYRAKWIRENDEVGVREEQLRHDLRNLLED